MIPKEPYSTGYPIADIREMVGGPLSVKILAPRP